MFCGFSLDGCLNPPPPSAKNTQLEDHLEYHGTVQSATELEARLTSYVRNTVFKNIKFFANKRREYSDNENGLQVVIMKNLGLDTNDKSEQAVSKRVVWWSRHWKKVRATINQKRDNVAAALLRKFDSEYHAGSDVLHWVF